MRTKLIAMDEETENFACSNRFDMYIYDKWVSTFLTKADRKHLTALTLNLANRLTGYLEIDDVVKVILSDKVYVHVIAIGEKREISITYKMNDIMTFKVTGGPYTCFKHLIINESYYLVDLINGPRVVDLYLRGDKDE